MSKVQDDVQYLGEWNYESAHVENYAELLHVHSRCIQAYGLLECCYKLLTKQSESPYVIDLLHQVVDDQDGDEVDGYYVLEAISDLLVESGLLGE